MKRMRLLSAFLLLAAVAYPQTSAPVITSATPNPVDAGGPSFTITVTLNAFVSGAVLKWSGTTLASPNYVDDHTLTALVPAGLIAICGKYVLTVTNPVNSTVSNSYPIIVSPVLKTVLPNVLPAGSGGVTVVATGLGFSSNVYLTLTASGAATNLATGYDGSTTTLTAFVPGSALTGAYPVSLFVSDPTTGAASQKLPITLTVATVSAITPNEIYAGTASCNLVAPACFTLNVVGANFVGGAQVLFNGSPLPTAYINSGYLIATVPAGLVHDAGDVGVSVRNPGTTATTTIKLVVDPNPFGTTITSLSPASALAGGPSLTLTLTGERFASTSTVLWVRTPLPTTFISSTQLTATIPVDLVAIDGVAPISVSTPGAPLSNAVNFPVLVASPTIAQNGISPTSAVAGGPAFTMTVTGDGFILASKVIGLTGATTTYVSLNQLTVSVPASAIATPGSSAIQVVNSGGRVSPQAPIFIVTGPAPAITSLSPATAPAGGPDFTLTINGSNFLANATAAWNGAALPTTRVSATQVTAQVSASLIAAPGTVKITVFNDGPAASNELTLTVSSPNAVSLSSLSPNAAAPGGAAFTLTATGTNFTASSTLQWNGTPLSTTFVGATQLTARVAAALIATAGTASVTVAGNGGTSNALPFAIAVLVPTISSAGILNAASSAPAIAPGTLIAIYGTNLAAATAQFTSTPLPVSLGGTSVSINDTPVPLLFVSPGQVNAQVPYETKVGTAKLVVQSNGVSSSAVNFAVAAAGPGVFTPQQSTHVLALNLADGTLNASQTPARPGQYVTAYLTGQGQVNPAVATGDVAPASPFSFPVAAPVQIRVGGVLATLQFAGMAPGFIGLLQMNVLIPDVPAGDLAFDVSIGGASAVSTVISIAAKP